MTDTLKILGQSLPTDTKYHTLYSPTGATATISSLTVCNTAISGTSSFNVLVVPQADMLVSANKHSLYSNLQIAASDTFIATLGITLANGDGILVKSLVGNDLAFAAYGDEVT